MTYMLCALAVCISMHCGLNNQVPISPWLLLRVVCLDMEVLPQPSGNLILPTYHV